MASSEPERAGLAEFLDWQREALINKVPGLSDEQARLTPTVSSLSLLSLVKHSAICERRWFQVIDYGSIDFAELYAEGIASAADEAFDDAFAGAIPGPDMAFLRALIPYMVGRTR